MAMSLPIRIALFLLLALTAGPAAAQGDNQMLIERMNRLENDLRTLQRSVYRGAPPPAPQGGSLTDANETDTSIANRLSARIDQLENQIRELVGRFEEVEFKNVQTQRRMDKLVEDVDFRLNQLEKGAPGGAPAPQQQAAAPAAEPAQPLVRGSTSSTPGAAPTREGVLGTMAVDAQGRPLPPGSAPPQTARAPAAPPPAAAPSARGKLPAGSPQDRYNYAYKLLVQSDYADAEAAFKEFIGAHGGDPLAGNAQYWLGETHYVRGQFEASAAAFLQGYQGYPKGAKAPDSLLKLGMSLTAMNKKPEACAAFGQLAKEFPAAPAHVKDALGRERARAGCR